MSIQVVKHINKDENNRIEYLFVNFDFFDGNDLVAKILLLNAVIFPFQDAL